MRFVPAVALALLVGCGGGQKAKLADVSGTVLLDKKPLPDGVIVFTKDGEIPREIKITDGKYAGLAFVGQNHLQFAVYRAPAGKAKAPAGPGADAGVPLENVLPGRYNQESREFREVKAGGNTFDFEVESK